MGISGRIAGFFLHSRLTPLIALVALLLGAFAVLVTPREEEPQIDVTMANVFIPFPGASAKDVENLVATPAEQVLARIAGIDHVYSVSRPGMAVLTVQYKVGEDGTKALVRLYDTLESHKDWLSPVLGVGAPIVKPKGIDDVPIVGLTLWTADPKRGAFELARVAHAMEVEIKRVPGTRDVATIGGPAHVVRVLMEAERMSAFGVTAQDVRAALQSSNASQPAGTLVKDNREVLVQTGAYLASAADVKQLVVGVQNGQPVFVTDVARVEDGPDLPTDYVWFGSGAAAGAKASGEHPAVTLAISKKPGQNAVDVAEQVIARVEALKGQIIPDGVNVTVTRNYGETANDKAMKLIQKLGFATLSVVALVWFALGRREAAIVGVAVILTLAATLFASWAWGFTLNRVSLFALIFSIGILVDDAIVVVENIHRHQQLAARGQLDGHGAASTDDAGETRTGQGAAAHVDRPAPGARAALARLIPGAVDEVGGPTILATLTVIAALLPMAFVTGLMGPYMSPIPINASMGMALSLAIAFVVTPWLALQWMKADPQVGHAEGGGRLERIFARMEPLLRGDAGRRNRFKLLGAIGAAIVIAVMLPVAKLVVLKMLPFDNKSEFQVIVDMPAGTPLERTAAVLRDLGAEIAKVPEVADYQAYAGSASPINFNGLVRQYYLRAAPELGDIQVNLVDKHHRSRKSHDIAQSLRPALEKVASAHGAELKVVEVPPGPPVMAPIVAEIYGPDYQGQLAIASRVREIFAKTQDIVAVDDSVDDSAPKLLVRIHQNKAALAGVAPRDIVDTMRMGLAGDNATPIHDGDAKYELPVRISLPSERQASLDDLLKLNVRTRSGGLVPLSELTEVVPVQREKTIHHKDLMPVAYVFGDMAGKLDSPLYGMFDIRGRTAGMALPEGGVLGEAFIEPEENRFATYSLKWDGEWKVTYETFRDMGIAYAVGLVLIYLLVVAQFGSYLVPLIIMAPIPLTIIGVMPGHALLGSQFTATSMIGMIALAGIIVRNSILLVDFVNLQVVRGVPLQDAVIQSAAARAKPIILTGLAAMLGALFILDDPIFNGLAISLLFGIAVSTLLTLLVIPVLYYAASYRRTR